jgi:hypothetical protein
MGGQNVPEMLPNDKVKRLISEIEKLLAKEGISFEIEKKKPMLNDDPWDNLDIEIIAVDMGIEDFAENHDYYLYGTPK